VGCVSFWELVLVREDDRAWSLTCPPCAPWLQIPIWKVLCKFVDALLAVALFVFGKRKLLPGLCEGFIWIMSLYWTPAGINREENEWKQLEECLFTRIFTMITSDHIPGQRISSHRLVRELRDRSALRRDKFMVLGQYLLISAAGGHLWALRYWQNCGVDKFPTYTSCRYLFTPTRFIESSIAHSNHERKAVMKRFVNKLKWPFLFILFTSKRNCIQEEVEAAQWHWKCRKTRVKKWSVDHNVIFLTCGHSATVLFGKNSNSFRPTLHPKYFGLI